MAERLRSVETNYKEVLNEMVNFQRDLGQHDMLVQSLIQHFLRVDQAMISNPITQNVLPDQNTTSTSPFYENPDTANPFFPEQGATLPVDDFMTDVSGGPLSIGASKGGPSFNLRTIDAPPRPDSVLARFMTSGTLPTPSMSPYSRRSRPEVQPHRNQSPLRLGPKLLASSSSTMTRSAAIYVQSVSKATVVPWTSHSMVHLL